MKKMRETLLSAKNILTSYKFDFQKIDELTIATADIAEIFEELEGSREDIERNTNIKINEFNSLENSHQF